MKSSALASRGFLSRRALLRGAGVTLALPFLESVAPRALRAAEPGAPVRLMYWFIPNGILYDIQPQYRSSAKTPLRPATAPTTSRAWAP